MITFLLNIVIFSALYLTIFWLLILINTKRRVEPPETYPGVTIIIPAYNEETVIQRTVESCLNLDYPGNLTIIAVDDNSQDNTLEKLQRYKDDITILEKDKNEGKAAALNTCLKKIQTDFFTVVDADSTLATDSLQKAMKYFYTDDGQEVAAVISKLKPDREPTNIIERMQLVEYMYVGLLRYLSATMRLLHITPGVLSIYKTDVVKDLGGFDEENVTEDFEMAVRIRKNGYLINYAADSKSYTRVPDTFSEFLGQRLRWGRGFFRTIFTHNNIFFDKQRGIFGLYEFPMNFLSVLILFAASIVLSYNVITGIYEFLFKIIYTPDVIVWWEFTSLNEMLLSYNTFINLPLLLSIILTFIFLYFVFIFYDYNYFRKNKIKKIIALFLYVMVYSYVFVYIFAQSLYDELTGIGYTWETKN